MKIGAVVVVKFDFFFAPFERTIFMNQEGVTLLTHRYAGFLLQRSARGTRVSVSSHESSDRQGDDGRRRAWHIRTR